ncbi:hypothetical protein BD410DRAFT_283621 [Rickenella mellea]|uniref:Uncharacterized protein n=1 Tax=Rickenella mellea TaxID=50990 RepID=A0A4Y7Q400_9AGAM|nr:hypothetical protein BD410DRAFT_283621 [Rickenella mellea]
MKETVALSNSKEQDNLKEDPGTGPSIAATASKVTLSGSVVNSSQRSQTSAPSAAPSDDMQGNARSSVTIKTRADSDKRNITAVAEATLPKLDHADPYSPHSPNAMDSGDKIPRDLTISEEAQGIVNASAKNVAPADEVARSKSKEELAAESPSPSLNAEDEAALDTEDLEATKRHEDIGLDRIAVDIKAESFKSVDQQTTKKWKENGHCDIDADAGVALLKSNEIENEKKGLGTVTGRIEDGERMPSSKLE